MAKVKQIEIKNWTYYFYNGIINLKNFKSNLLKTDKKTLQRHLIFITLDTSKLKKIGDCENIHSLNLLYLLVNHAKGHIGEKN